MELRSRSSSRSRNTSKNVESLDRSYSPMSSRERFLTTDADGETSSARYSRNVSPALHHRRSMSPKSHCEESDRDLSSVSGWDESEQRYRLPWDVNGVGETPPRYGWNVPPNSRRRRSSVRLPPPVRGSPSRTFLEVLQEDVFRPLIDRIMQNPWRSFFFLCGIVFLAPLLFNRTSRGTSHREIYIEQLKRLTESYNLSPDGQAVLLGILPRWSGGRTVEPLVLLVAGRSENVHPFVKKLHRASALATMNDASSSLFVCTNDTQRSTLHSYLEKNLVNRSVPALTTLLSVEHLSWEAPVALQAFFEDENPLSTQALIILGAGIDVTSEHCEEDVQRRLLELWTEQGGSFDSITPIINTRIDFIICV